MWYTKTKRRVYHMKNEYKNEIWKAIVNYEGIYEVSNYGRVRRISYENTQYRRKKNTL